MVDFVVFHIDPKDCIAFNKYVLDINDQLYLKINKNTTIDIINLDNNEITINAKDLMALHIFLLKKNIQADGSYVCYDHMLKLMLHFLQNNCFELVEYLIQNNFLFSNIKKVSAIIKLKRHLEKICKCMY